MTVIYFADGARAIQPKNKFQEADLKKWLMGKKEGELLDSELNPKIL